MTNLSTPTDGQFEGRVETEQGKQGFVMSGPTYAVWLESQGIKPEDASSPPHNLPHCRADGTYLLQVSSGGRVSVQFVDGVDLSASVDDARRRLTHLFEQALGEEIEPANIEIPYHTIRFLNQGGEELDTFSSPGSIHLGRLTGIPKETVRIESVGGVGAGPWIVGDINAVCQALEAKGLTGGAQDIRLRTKGDPEGSMYAIPEAMKVPDNYLRLNTAA